MKILFIDTSSTDVSIAIIKDGIILSNINKTIPNAHSIYTVNFIDKALKDTKLKPSDIDKILVVTGPGSFTGVRIGVTIAKTYAYLNKINIVEISSLKMLALSCEHDYCLALINAKNNNYYLGLYDKNNNEIIEEQFNTIYKVLELIKKYNPTIVSQEEITIENIKTKKQILNIKKICSYYQEKDSTNIHLIVPNYLKLPSALEEKWLEK